MIANAIFRELSSERDEAPFLRCALLSELVARDATVQRMTQLPTRCAVDLAAVKVSRQVSGYGAGSPYGRILAVYLGLFSWIVNNASLPNNFGELAAGTWGSFNHHCGSHPDADVRDAASWPLHPCICILGVLEPASSVLLGVRECVQ